MLQNTQEQNSLLDDIVEDTMYYRTFFGKDADYYEERRERLLAGTATVFNPYAFFLGFFWMAYRKMYLELIVLTVVMGLIECLLLFVFDVDNPTLDRMLNLFWAIGIGVFANTFYLKKATRTVDKAKQMYAGTGDQLDYLEKEGGTSAIGPLVIGIIFVAMVVGSILLETYIAGL